MSNQLHIRPAKADEMPDVKELVFRTAHEMMEPETPYEQLKSQWNEWGIFDDLDDVEVNYISQGGAFFISECDGQIVGTGAFLRY
jgi:hypothetical protein